MREFKKMCKEILGEFVKVSIERDTKNKLYYIKFTSVYNTVFRTITFSEIKWINHMKDMLEQLKIIL